MEEDRWYLVIGAVLVTVTLVASLVKRLPLTVAMLYLGAGWAIGKLGLGFLDPAVHAEVLERVTELAVIISLFTCGLKLRPALNLAHWAVPLRLAFLSMALTVAAIAVVAVFLLGFDWGHAVLLGAILAPTDPVLASDVQVARPGDTDRLRFGLTGEAALNDGTAFPFVMLGLGLLGAHPLGEDWRRWLGVDLLWAVLGGLGIGYLLGIAVGRLVTYLRVRHKEALGSDDFLALGLIALAYGTALAAQAYGFLAVFAAGLALRTMESRSSQGEPDEEVAREARLGREHEVQTHPEKGAAYMAEAVLGFNQQFERITELALMLTVGVLLASIQLPTAAIWFAPLLLLVLRPVAVQLGLLGSGARTVQLGLISWFGVRGIGSLYYLFYAANHGLDEEGMKSLAPLVLSVIAVSVVAHGMSVTPAMRWYARWSERQSGG